MMFGMQPKLKGFIPEECSVWTYYIPKEREEFEWDLYFVLLVAFLEAKGIRGRVALGKVSRASFSHSRWSEIILG